MIVNFNSHTLVEEQGHVELPTASVLGLRCKHLINWVEMNTELIKCLMSWDLESLLDRDLGSRLISRKGGFKKGALRKWPQDPW